MGNPFKALPWKSKHVSSFTLFMDSSYPSAYHLEQRLSQIKFQCSVISAQSVSEAKRVLIKMGRGDEGMNEEEGFLKDMIAQLSREGCKEFIKLLIFKIYGLHTNSINVI